MCLSTTSRERPYVRKEIGRPFTAQLHESQAGSSGPPTLLRSDHALPQGSPLMKGQVRMRFRLPYNCRHTYATMRATSNMPPAFIAQQLGHSVQCCWRRMRVGSTSSSDWAELEKLRMDTTSVSGKMTSSNPLIGKVIDLHS